MEIITLLFKYKSYRSYGFFLKMVKFLEIEEKFFKNKPLIEIKNAKYNLTFFIT